MEPTGIYAEAKFASANNTTHSTTFPRYSQEDMVKAKQPRAQRAQICSVKGIIVSKEGDSKDALGASQYMKQFPNYTKGRDSTSISSRPPAGKKSSMEGSINPIRHSNCNQKSLKLKIIVFMLHDLV